MASGSERQVARNFVALASGEALSRVVAFGTTVYLARVLGAGSYGLIALAAGVNLYLAKAADFGIESMGAQEIARAGGELSTHSRFVSAVIGVRLLLTLGLIAFAMGVVHFTVS